MILIFSRSYFSVKFSVWGKWYKRKSSFVLKMSLKCNKRRYHVSDDKEAVGYPSALFSNHYESRKGIFIIRAKVVYKYSRVHVFFSSVAFILFISPIYFILYLLGIRCISSDNIFSIVSVTLSPSVQIFLWCYVLP